MNTLDVLDRLDTLSEEENEEVQYLKEITEEELKVFHCHVIIRKYEPVEIPALHYMDNVSKFSRYADRSSKEIPGLWGNLMGSIAGSTGAKTLCLNYQNALVKNLMSVQQETLLRQYIKIIYLQSVLMGNYQLTQQELGMLIEGLQELLIFRENY